MLLTCGLASITFYCLWWVIDVRQWRGWARPFEQMGRNALLAFVGSGIAARILSQTGAQQRIMADWLNPLASPSNASLLYSLSLVALFLLLTSFLDRRGVYLRL